MGPAALKTRRLDTSVEIHHQTALRRSIKNALIFASMSRLSSSKKSILTPFTPASDHSLNHSIFFAVSAEKRPDAPTRIRPHSFLAHIRKPLPGRCAPPNHRQA